ncbi:MAG: hypothetical protein IT438_13875 [Phycisphaerales bacterium]|nr:hypothetical protein [Phycisphaerales bacterium]
MSTSQRTFDQVRSILGKLDRDIDAARQKRLQVRQPQPVSAPNPPMSSIPAAVPGTASLATPRPITGTSGFGRAQPMRLEHRKLSPG